MNTANKITLIRVFLVPVFAVLFMIDNTACRMAALAVFVTASATDALDGYIARSRNQITTFGKFADPLADKMLTTAAFLILMHYGRMSVWAVMIILAREFMVSGVRLAAAGSGKVVAASVWGKLKTVSQMAAIIAAILLMSAPQFLMPKLISDILIWISVALTIISGADYLIKNWKLMELK